MLIVGAGAAGLFCAMHAGRGGRRVLLLDHANRIGKKILISGGGRCNFTNLHTTAENFLSANPHFAKSALARYTPADFLELVEKHQIPWHEKTLGQLFCDRTASDIVSMLEQECAAAGVTILLNARVARVEQGFHLQTDRGGVLRALSGHRQRRSFHSEDGRYPVWLPGRAAVWLEDSTLPAGPGAAHLCFSRT